nr:4Fe-4S binding protein [Methanomicrobium sp. W14]
MLLAGGSVLLASPACAAICPRGIGECPYPGKCFLFVDSDGNSLCDYTSQSPAPSPSGTDSATLASSTSEASGGKHGSHYSSVVSSSSADSSSASNTTAGSSPGSGLSPLFYTAAGLLVAGFAVICIYFAMKHLKKVNPEIYGRIFMYAGFIPIFLALLIILDDPGMFGFSGIFADISASYAGIVYMFGGTVLMAFLWMKNRLSKEALISVLIVTSAAGFILVFPIAPDGFYSIHSSVTALRFAGLGSIGLFVLLFISFVSGRVFCGHMCPAGALQELLSRIPVKKIKIADRRIPNYIRLSVFVLLLAGAYFSYDIFMNIGVSYFFALIFTASAWIFVLVLAASVFVYRPFCTFLCPFGLFFSVFSYFGRMGLKRTDKCIECRKCEKICPTCTAGRDDSRSECYLCGRCIEKCPVDGAIVYGRRV